MYIRFDQSKWFFLVMAEEIQHLNLISLYYGHTSKTYGFLGT